MVQAPNLKPQPLSQISIDYDADLTSYTIGDDTGSIPGRTTVRFELRGGPTAGTVLHPPGWISPMQSHTITGTASSCTQLNETTVRLTGTLFDTTTSWFPNDDSGTASGSTYTIGGNVYHTSSGTVDIDTRTGAWSIPNTTSIGGWDLRANLPLTHGWVHDERAAKRHMLRLKQQERRVNHRGNTYRSMHLGNQFADARKEELVALQLLRQMVSTDVFRKYLKHGIVSVRGASGLTYQIKRMSHLITVWDQGVKLATLCVYLRDHTIPPTDEVVAKIVMCELDEEDIWKRANVGWKVGDTIQRENSKIMELGVAGRTHAAEDYRWRAA